MKTAQSNTDARRVKEIAKIKSLARLGRAYVKPEQLPAWIAGQMALREPRKRFTDSEWNELSEKQRVDTCRLLEELGFRHCEAVANGELQHFAVSDEFSGPVEVEAFVPQEFEVWFHDPRLPHHEEISVSVANASSRQEATRKAVEFLRALSRIGVDPIETTDEGDEAQVDD